MCVTKTSMWPCTWKQSSQDRVRRLSLLVCPSVIVRLPILCLHHWLEYGSMEKRLEIYEDQRRPRPRTCNAQLWTCGWCWLVYWIQGVSNRTYRREQGFNSFDSGYAQPDNGIFAGIQCWYISDFVTPQSVIFLTEGWISWPSHNSKSTIMRTTRQSLISVSIACMGLLLLLASQGRPYEKIRLECRHHYFIRLTMTLSNVATMEHIRRRRHSLLSTAKECRIERYKMFGNVVPGTMIHHYFNVTTTAKSIGTVNASTPLHNFLYMPSPTAAPASFSTIN